MSGPGTDGEKLVDLEIKLGFVERTVEELSEVIVEQAKTIEKLELKVERLDEKLTSKADGGMPDAPDPLDEKPPHY